MERDDIIEYSLDAHHSEEDGKKIRKKIVFVTVLLTIITLVEVAMGVVFKRAETFDWEVIRMGFIILTLVKAGYIVMIFMHLGDERKAFKWVILMPYIFFILYLLYIALRESTFAWPT